VVKVIGRIANVVPNKTEYADAIAQRSDKGLWVWQLQGMTVVRGLVVYSLFCRPDCLRLGTISFTNRHKKTDPVKEDPVNVVNDPQRRMYPHR